MLILFETPAGLCLFKKDKLIDFKKFENTTDALKTMTAIVEGQTTHAITEFLTKHKQVLVQDAKLCASLVKSGVDAIFDSEHLEQFRHLRTNLASLIQLDDAHMSQMVLGLSHSLSRYKLKFSPDKVDTMIIQAIALLDDLDKELNTYSMRVKEWYGWHFPEMAKIIVDNVAFAKSVKLMGYRTSCQDTDFSDILPEDLEAILKSASQVSMGTEISEQDLENMLYLCDQIISISEYRDQLFEYLKNRMAAIAPNLTVLVGELVGARLISHAGSLLNLAKQPASTVQILGAEKALFRALKSKHDTPKYGLIYHASLVGQAGPKNKGKLARTLATKCALAIRCDALGEGQDTTADIGIELRAKVETRLRQLEGKSFKSSVSTPQAKVAFGVKPTYNDASDMTKTQKRKASPEAVEMQSAEKKKKSKKDKKEKTDAPEPAAKKSKTESSPAADIEIKKKKKKSSKE